jgi:hypothetical protein
VNRARVRSPQFVTEGPGKELGRIVYAQAFVARLTSARLSLDLIVERFSRMDSIPDGARLFRCLAARSTIENEIEWSGRLIVVFLRAMGFFRAHGRSNCCRWSTNRTFDVGI